MSAGAVKNQVRVNEKLIFSTPNKESVLYKEYNELKVMV